MDLSNILIVLRKEFEDSLRSRWLQATALIYALLALLIAYMGMITRGEGDLHILEITLASLVNLAIYLIPLIALLLGHSAIAGEVEGGSLAMLLALPVSRREVLLGKFFGLSLSLAAASLGGFGSSWLLIALRMGFGSWRNYLIFILLGIILGMCFLSLSLLISVSLRRQSMALGITVFIWFLLAVVFDLVLLGIFMAAAGKINTEWMTALVLLNPVDVFRLFNLLRLDAFSDNLGLVSLVPPLFRHPVLLLGMLLLWIVVPLGVADKLFRAADY